MWILHTDNIVNDMVSLPLTLIDVTSSVKIPVSKDSPVVMIESTVLTMISGSVLLQAPPTYHIQWMHAFNCYVFILHDSFDFSQICGGHEVCI